MVIKIQGTTIINDQTAYIDFAPSTAAKVPVGTDAQRPTGVTGRIRYNNTQGYFEAFYGAQWCPFGSVALGDLGAPVNPPASTANIWSWGSGTSGRLGDGSATARCSAVREISSSTDWCQVSAGRSHAVAIKQTGQLWSWGLGNVGQLGEACTFNRCSPVREVCLDTTWCRASGSGNSTHAIKTDGSLWAWGFAQFGQLGDGTTVDKCSPVREICSATNWKDVCGVYATIALKTDGSVWTWGAAACGALGDGTTVDKCSPIREICSATNWCNISMGGLTTPIASAIKTDGSLWAWGDNNDGKLGDGTTTPRCSPVREFSASTTWRQVSNGFRHMAAVKNDNSLFTWGQNNYGQLASGTTVARCSPVREICNTTGWLEVSAGECHTAAVRTNGQIWTFGSNTNGRLGDGTTVARCSPVVEFCSGQNWSQVSAGGNFTVAVQLL